MRGIYIFLFQLNLDFRKGESGKKNSGNRNYGSELNGVAVFK